MNRCTYCGNENRDNAIFCNQCSKPLSYLIQVEFSKDLNKTLGSLISKVNKTNEGYELNQEIRHNITLFWNMIFKYSNFETVIRNDEITIDGLYYNLPLNLSYKLKHTTKNSIFTKFIVELNNYYKEYKQSLSTQKYEYLFLTNINKSKINENVFKLLELFNFEIYNLYDLIKINDSIFNNHEKKILLQNITEKRLILKYEIKGKESGFVYNQAIKNICSFLGFITLSDNYNKYHEVISSTSFESNYNLSEYKIVSSISFSETISAENKHYLLLQLDCLNTKIYGFKVEINKFFLDKYKQVEDKIYLKINEYLNLYYLASIENDLSTSFLKYWSLSERIIKDMCNTMVDEKLLKLMKNILILAGHPNYVYNQLVYIYKKRNAYVHEFNPDIINESDRNLIKLVSDKLLGFIICYNDKITDFNDYGYILEYLNKKEEIVKIYNLLEDISK